MHSLGPCMRGSAPLPYEPNVIGFAAVPTWDSVSGPDHEPPRLKSTRSPGARDALPALLKLRQGVVSLLPLLESFPDALSTK